MDILTSACDVVPRNPPLLKGVGRVVAQARERRISAWSAGGRVAASVIRRHTPGLARARVSLDDRGTRVLADLREPFGLTLYRFGFRVPEVRLIQMLLRPGDVFVDGGAHIGIFTLIAAAAVGASGRVIACEPVPQNLELLKRNLALNDFDWVETHEVALGEKPGQAELFSFGRGSALSSFAPSTRQGTEKLPVRVTSLDDVVDPYRSRVRVVKLDIEGAELRAMHGAPKLLKAQPDFVLELEPEHLARQGAEPADLQAVFAAAGYRGYEIQELGGVLVLEPMNLWQRPSGSPNIFISARPPDSLPIPVREVGPASGEPG